MKAMHSFSRTCLFSSLFALALSNVSIAHAQETTFTTRVGFVNSERLFGEAKASLAAQNKLKQEFSARERQLVTQADNLKKAIDRPDRHPAEPGGALPASLRGGPERA